MVTAAITIRFGGLGSRQCGHSGGIIGLGYGPYRLFIGNLNREPQNPKP